MIIHHWDCDGICSAALLKNNAKDELFVPNDFFLNDKEKKYIEKRNPARIYLVDMALPENDVTFLKSVSELYVFDHHKRKEKEENFYTDEDSPSTTFIIKKHYKLKDDFLPVLGAVGDKEEKILDTKYKKNVENVLEKYNMNFDQLLKITALLDSNFILNDFEAVKRSVDFVLKNKNNPRAILENKKLNMNLEKIEKEIKDNLNYSIKNNFVLCEINTKYRIISKIARILFKKYPDKNILVINRKRGNIYVRSKKDLSFLIENAKERYFAGGKRDVCGIILPQNEIDTYTEKIKTFVEVS
ncbi:MAG: DHH family phosphoesterase [Methanomicrobia archaeon]|nr:DHH family phosphoesterase [Methanomicrobia archaeon]